MAELRRAVVVGVNEYRDSKIQPLRGAVNDATELRRRLEESDNFEIGSEHFLVNQDATCAAIRKAISDLLWKPDQCALAIFYFSGHGFRDEYGNGYIAPHDINSREPLVCGIRMQELTEIVLAAKNKQAVVVILDCCYSGLATDPAKGDNVLPLEDPRLDQWFSNLEAQELGNGQGRIILASSGKDEKSRENYECMHELSDGEDPRVPHEHGKFTFHLLEGLDGKAAVHNDKVTLGGLYKYVERELKDHKMSFFGASVAQVDQIIIGRASRWQRLNNSLIEAQQLFRENNPLAICRAAQTLKPVLDSCPHLQAACLLRDGINTKFREYGNKATTWLTNKRLQLYDFRDQIKSLRTSTACLSIDTFITSDESTQGLLISLFEVAAKLEPDEAFINSLRAGAGRGSADRQHKMVIPKPEVLQIGRSA